MKKYLVLSIIIVIALTINVQYCFAKQSNDTFSFYISTDNVSMGSQLHPDYSPIVLNGIVTASITNTRANNRWTLQVNALGNLISNSQSTVIPISQIQVKGGDLVDYRSLSIESPLNLITNPQIPGKVTYDIGVDYRFMLNWKNVAANDYTTSILYTLTGSDPRGSKGAVQISSVPGNADIYLDGIMIGQTKYVSDKLDAGYYDLAIAKIGYVTYNSELTVYGDQTVDVSFKLKPIK